MFRTSAPPSWCSSTWCSWRSFSIIRTRPPRTRTSTHSPSSASRCRPACFRSSASTCSQKWPSTPLPGLEQVAVFAGETRDAAKAILRSAWIAAPLIAAIFILGTASLLTYIPAQSVDLVGPVPQVLAAAFNGGGPVQGIDWGLMLGRAAILGLAVTVIAQYALIIAETSRLPLVAGWDGILPAWFTRLSPRFGTPVRSILVIIVLGLISGLLASSGAGKQEAFQLLTTSANILYAVYYGMMLLIPIVVGSRFGTGAGAWLKIAAGAAFLVTLLATAMNLFPIVDVASPILFGIKVFGVAVLVNALGAALYYTGKSRTRLA